MILQLVGELHLYKFINLANAHLMRTWHLNIGQTLVRAYSYDLCFLPTNHKHEEINYVKFLHVGFSCLSILGFKVLRLISNIPVVWEC